MDLLLCSLSPFVFLTFVFHIYLVSRNTFSVYISVAGLYLISTICLKVSLCHLFNLAIFIRLSFDSWWFTFLCTPNECPFYSRSSLIIPVTVCVCLVLRTFCAKFNLLVSHHVYDSLQLLGYWNSDGKDHIGFVLLTIDSTKIQPLRLEWTYISHSMIIIMINTKDLQKRRKN